MNKLKATINNFISSNFRSLSLIYTLTAVSFSNIFNNQFILDDFYFIVDWPLIRNINNIPHFFFGYVPPVGQEGIYAPLKTMFHAMAYHFFSYNVFGYHLLSLLVHFLAIYFIYKIIELMTEDKMITFLATLFFALHPIHCESISSMTASIDTIGSVFLLASVYFYIKKDRGKNHLTTRFYVLSLIFCVLAIFSQELTAALPFLILLYDYCFNKDKMNKKQIVKNAIPYFLIILFYLLCKYLVLGGISRGQYIYDSFYLTMLVSIKALAKYVWLLFFPIVLTHNHVISKGIYSFDVLDFDEFYVVTQSIWDGQVLLSLCVLAFLIFVFFRCLKDKPVISFAIGWFYLSLLPVLNIVPSGVYFAERYLYFASMGFCLLIAIYFVRLYSGKGKILRMDYSSFTLMIICVLCLFYGLRTWMRNADMKDEITAFQSAVKANPASALMRTDLGIIYTQYNQPEEALKSFREALRIKEDADTYFAMAEAYTMLGQNQKAENSLQKAIKINPEFADGYYNLASLYAFWAQMEKARMYLKKALFYYEKQDEKEKAEEYKEVFENYFGPVDAIKNDG